MFRQILLTSVIRNVWRSVMRICIFISGLQGLTSCLTCQNVTLCRSVCACVWRGKGGGRWGGESWGVGSWFGDFHLLHCCSDNVVSFF